MEELNIENYKIALQEIKQKDILCSWIRRLTIVKVYYPLNYSKDFPIKIPADFFFF